MNHPTKPAHVLIVEDEKDTREAVATVLEESGYTVATANDGQMALEYLDGASRHPDLILLDLRMPNMDGVQFRQEQLKSARHAPIPVVVVTADQDAREKANQLGVQGLVRKPFESDTLLKEINRILTKNGNGNGKDLKTS